MVRDKQPWTPAEATAAINEISANKSCDLAITRHARDRMNERGLIMSDLLFVLKNGFVYDNPQESTVEGFFKYVVESQSPNSGSRVLKVVAIPDSKSCRLKIVTFMWRDEQ